MKYEFNTNNNKKLIIGIAILFCAVILLVGTTTAFFTESETKEIGNIVTSDIEGTLLYRDDYEENNLYNRQGLIPADLDVVVNTYKRTDGNKCLDQNNYSSCSVYRFSVKNNAEVVQQLVMTLNPTANSYNNLKLLLFEIKNNNSEQISSKPISLEKGNYSSIQLIDNFILTSNEERVYELVFYVENQNYAQDDAGKEFGAGISINSVTTGYNVTKQYGTTCWVVDPKDSSKLISFNGINHDTSITSFKESVVESCSGYVEADEEGFTVTIPSTFNNVKIKSIGNLLLNAVIIENGEFNLNKYKDIKKIIIKNGIERIDEGDIGAQGGAFMAIGVDLTTGNPFPDKTLEVILPNSLTYIGQAAFAVTPLRELNIPGNVEEISHYAFYNTANLTTLNFDYNSDKLKTIGGVAFQLSNLNYSEDNPLVIPSSVEYIGDSAFQNDGEKSNPNLKGIEYKGDHLSNFDVGWYTKGNTTLNPNG